MKSNVLTLSSYGIENVPAVTHRIQLKILDEVTNDTFQITVENTDGTTYRLSVHSKMTVFELKKIIRNRTKGLVKNQKLFFEGNDMKIHEWTLSLYGIENVSGITHRIQLKVFHDELIETFPLKHIHAAIGVKYLSPKWHVDLRNVTDNGKTRFRGGSAYNRPLGCMRFGIRVLGKYNRGKDNTWLGLKGVDRIRTNTDGEWPVAYHGTNEQSVLSILEEGFRLDKGTRFLYGHGIYCTPDPLTALEYAFKSVYQGEELQLIIQCRVDPAKMRVVAQPSQTGLGEYWLMPSGHDIRPYAVCAYEKKPISSRPLVSVQNINYQQANGITRNNVATAQSTSSNGNVYSGFAPRISTSSAAFNSKNLQARASNSSNIFPGVPRNNTLNTIPNARSPIASQVSPGSSSISYNGIHNVNSNAFIRSTVTRVAPQGTSYNTTSNNVPNSTLNPGNPRASQSSYCSSTHAGGTLPIHWQGTSYQSISNSSNTNSSNAYLRSTTARVAPRSTYQYQRIPDSSDSNNSSWLCCTIL
ncbi:poly(ADP-ribose) polymerase catalytic domain-containing protein [Ditylenchus destructor]|nr:poly(ADP-ribose) polymerase catalytic domain-containing protein [Ditylenchus destructor]